jgi:hypothetical protein
VVGGEEEDVVVRAEVQEGGAHEGRAAEVKGLLGLVGGQA